MYITMAMLADELDKEKILNATIKKHDKICTIRIQMDSEPMKSEILYLTDRKGEGILSDSQGKLIPGKGRDVFTVKSDVCSV